MTHLDCNYEDALSTSLKSSFSNQGEICLCGSRIFVEKCIYDRFINDFAIATKKIKVGNPLSSDTEMGALVSLEHMNKVLGHIQLARDEGGKILAGGKRCDFEGLFLEPTVIIDLDPINSRIQKEEIFGPVVTICSFDSENEVIDAANATEYGLSATVWTLNLDRATRVSRMIQSGTVWINSWMARDLNVPFGGMKNSGLGREGGAYSEHFFCDSKTICIKNPII